MGTLWDTRFENDFIALEKWLYGKQSLTGATRQWFVDEVRKWPKGTSLLDAGCGGGVTAYHLAENKLLDNITYTGIDGSTCMLKLAKTKVKHSNVHWVQSALDTLSCADTFDKVLLRAVIEHNLDPCPVLISVANTVKPGGILYVIFWNNPVFTGKAKIKKTKDGFYDNSHCMKLVTKTLKDCGMTLTHKEFIKEQSENSDERFIVMFKKDV